MKGWKRLLLIGLLTTQYAVGQYGFFPRHYLEPERDTVFITKRSGTERIDSLDRAYYNLNPSLFNNGRAYLPEFRELTEWGSYRHLFGDERVIYRSDFHFTALPYMGFFYSFGSGGDQVMDVRYTHNFGQKVNLSFRYHRVADNGQMRRTKVGNNDVNLKLSYSGTRFRSYLDGYFGFDNYFEHGGIADPADLENLALALVPVQRTSADVNVRRAYITWKNYLALGKDSLQRFNLYVNPSFHTFRRRYVEAIDTAMFPNYLLDADSTRDNWQEPHLLLDAGVLLKTKAFQLSAGYVFDYWRFDNLGQQFSGVDNYIVSGLKWRFRGFELTNNFRFFVTGNPFEFKDEARLSYAFKSHRVGADFLIENYFIEPFQMRYTANYFNWENAYSGSNATTRLLGGLFYELTGKQALRVDVRQLVMSNPWVFENGNWLPSGRTQSVFAPRIRGALRFWKFSSHTTLEMFVSNKSVISHPDYRIRSRFFLDSPIFKAKRLLLATGVEFTYMPDYELNGYLPELSVFQYIPGNGIQSVQNIQLDFFLNFQIDRFRFMIQAGGLNNLWDDAPRYNAVGHPVRPFYMRLGLAWDFVN